MTSIFCVFSLGLTAALAGCAAQTPSSNLPPQAVVRQDRPVKMIHGEPYVYVGGESGSKTPGRWVPQGSPAAEEGRSTEAVDPTTVQKWQGDGDR